jgi:1-acyl-sn-glycerol-3-phosphate acyltransferase
MLGIAMAYRLVRGVIRLLLRLFYRRVEVVGAERIPREGPLLIVANHHNSLVDPMLIMATFPRRIRVLAKAGLFHHPLIGPFLWALGAVPVNRRLEPGEDPARNVTMFATAIATLRAGGAILIFPEGHTQPRPTLLPLRTGAARMLLGAEAGGARARVTLLPVGLVFERPATFRAGSAIVSIGPPVDTAAAAIAAPAIEPEAPARRLTEQLGEALRAQFIEAEDQHTLELVSALERAWREERGGAPVDAETSLAWRREVMRAARTLAERVPERVAEFRRRLEAYGARLRESALDDEALGRPYTAGGVARWVVVNTARLALTLPPALAGIAIHALPYGLTALAVRLMARTEEEIATDKIMAGAVLYPACWALEAWLVRRGLGVEALVVFVVLVAPAGLVALAWRERLGCAARQAAAFGRFVLDRRLHADLLAERRALLAEARALAELAGAGRR